MPRHARSLLPAMRAYLARAAGMAVIAAGALALAPVSAQSMEIYRYKDPFGIWRSMKVPNGYGKYYKRALARAAMRAGGPKACMVCDPRYAGGLDPLDPTTRALRWSWATPSADHDALIARAAQDSGVDQALLTAVIAVESGFRSNARSPKGALGLMQLMPATAAPLLGVADVETALVDPATNVRAGSRHLRRLIDQYPGRLDLALAAYNAGEAAVSKYDGVPPYAETQAYVRDVTALYQHYKSPVALP